MATRTTSDLPALELVAREPMAGGVYAQFREAIMTGRFAPGQLLSLRAGASIGGRGYRGGRRDDRGRLRELHGKHRRPGPPDFLTPPSGGFFLAGTQCRLTFPWWEA